MGLDLIDSVSDHLVTGAVENKCFSGHIGKGQCLKSHIFAGDRKWQGRFLLP